MRAIAARAGSPALSLWQILGGLFAATAICLPLWAAEPDSPKPAGDTGGPQAAPDTESRGPQSQPFDTLVLGSAEPHLVMGDTQGRLFPRELARQAVLIAARDGLRLATRDATLRESDAKTAPQAKRIEMQTADVRGARLKVQLIDPSRKSSFKARSLLYAQRLLQHEPQNPVGYWHRGFALAMAGLYQLPRRIR